MSMNLLRQAYATHKEGTKFYEVVLLNLPRPSGLIDYFVIRVWGGIGKSGQIRVERVENYSKALRRYLHVIESKTNRDYVFNNKENRSPFLDVSVDELNELDDANVSVYPGATLMALHPIEATKLLAKYTSCADFAEQVKALNLGEKVFAGGEGRTPDGHLLAAVKKEPPKKLTTADRHPEAWGAW